jgi:hypothetical protein
MRDDDDRTSPLGLFNFARSYWQSGVQLHRAKVEVSHPDAPVTLLLAHAIELYIKSFLRLHGLGAREVKTSFGHDFRKLVEEAAARGLRFDDEDKEVADIITEQESIRRSRHIESGFYARPSLPALSRMCRSLDQSVSAALRVAGHKVHAEALESIETDEAD